MNLSTVLISIGLVALVILALRHTLKNGTCSGCSAKDSCHSGSGCNCCHPEEIEKH